MCPLPTGDGKPARIITAFEQHGQREQINEEVCVCPGLTSKKSVTTTKLFGNLAKKNIILVPTYGLPV